MFTWWLYSQTRVFAIFQEIYEKCLFFKINKKIPCRSTCPLKTIDRPQIRHKLVILCQKLVHSSIKWKKSFFVENIKKKMKRLELWHQYYTKCTCWTPMMNCTNKVLPITYQELLLSSPIKILHVRNKEVKSL